MFTPTSTNGYIVVALEEALPALVFAGLEVAAGPEAFTA
eukprot:CAMPEP_0206537198 /NCGR_PEP_ID=MMETSP0325_2-20121206/7188_1 /ASSEMBLY_ACC=CAM_ASM_000347 /TAXON_ID=2866 /ORGANISM="Crypthecodinium cohnii, Strain Seligo" /LENGTH=38 /DNA_ID= /DNA_START= /DNA_END= /DNA_ORIENTATION=